ncbi:hypothetical protein Tco_1031171 [Tanacetum coccineum]|uniref:Uncharacterized protein n=1 Tax=Tanacetum coccineum TaxID=301880 RepID=A0ABQ5G882_9ASTR
MESVKKSIDERALHKREYDTRVNERQIQTTEGKIDTGNALDANIRPIYNEEPMTEVQTTTKINVFATGQQHTKQPEFNNEGEVDQNVKQCHDTCPLPAKVNDNQTTELTNQSLEFENICLKKTVAQFQKDFSRMEAHCVNLELKYQNQVLNEGQHGQFSKVKSNEAKTVGLGWVSTGKIFTSSTTKVDSEPQNGSNDDVTNQYECKQTLDVSAGTINIHVGTSLNPTKEGLQELGIHDHNNELSSSKLVPKVVPPANNIATSRQELELLFHHHITMLSDFMVPTQSNVSSVTNDAYMMIYNDMCKPHAQSVSKTTRNIVVDNSLNAELETYKEQVELYERRARKHDEIERKNLLIANDNLIVDCLFQRCVFHVVNNSELSLKYQNLKESFRNDTSPPTRDVPDFDSVFVIEKMKASIQGKDNAIKKLRMQISQLNETRSEADQNGKIKQHYKELYDSIKITRAKHLEQTTALLTENESLKVQIQNKLSCVNKDQVKPKVLAPGKYE